MAFPSIRRYFLDFRNSDVGLTPSLPVFQRADTFVPIAPPTIIEVSNGRYYFDWTWTLSTDPDITFVCDGGVAIPTEEVRYIKGTLSPRDSFIDEPIGQIVTDVSAALPVLVAAAVWNALLVTYAGVGSFGEKLTATAIDEDMKRALGMLHENSCLDQTTFNGDNNLLTGRLRLYDSKANADAAQAASPGVYDTGKIAEYSIIATYTGANLKTYKVSREA